METETWNVILGIIMTVGAVIWFTITMPPGPPGEKETPFEWNIWRYISLIGLALFAIAGIFLIELNGGDLFVYVTLVMLVC